MQMNCIYTQPDALPSFQFTESLDMICVSLFHERVSETERELGICISAEHYIIPLTLQYKQYASYLFNIGCLTLSDITLPLKI